LVRKQRFHLEIDCFGHGSGKLERRGIPAAATRACITRIAVFDRGADHRAYVDPQHWMYFDSYGDFHYDAERIAHETGLPLAEVVAARERMVSRPGRQPRSVY
jgi:hypothetical protein